MIYKATQLYNPRGSEFQIPNICIVQIQTTNNAEVKEEDYEYDYELEPVSVVQGDIIVDDDDDETGRSKSVFTTDPDR